MKFFSVTKQPGQQRLYFFLLRRCRNGNRFWLYLWRKLALRLNARKQKQRGFKIKLTP